MLELDGEMYPVRVRWLWLLHRAVITVGLMIGAGIWHFVQNHSLNYRRYGFLDQWWS